MVFDNNQNIFFVVKKKHFYYNLISSIYYCLEQKIKQIGFLIFEKKKGSNDGFRTFFKSKKFDDQTIRKKI